MKKEQISLVKSNKFLRMAIQSRMEELGLKLQDIIDDAKYYGVSLHKSGLSKYLNNKTILAMSEENLIWLAVRYGIPIKLEIGELKPFDEKKALELLDKVYGGK